MVLVAWDLTSYRADLQQLNFNHIDRSTQNSIQTQQELDHKANSDCCRKEPHCQTGAVLGQIQNRSGSLQNLKNTFEEGAFFTK